MLAAIWKLYLHPNCLFTLRQPEVNWFAEAIFGKKLLRGANHRTVTSEKGNIPIGGGWKRKRIKQAPNEKNTMVENNKTNKAWMVN